MKVGIIGLGFRLGYLGYVFKAMDESFGIAGYVDPNPAGLSTLTEKGIPAGKAYATPEELIANEKLDLLMIGSPNHMHLDHIRIGLEAGLKVFSEKPIVTTIEPATCSRSAGSQPGTGAPAATAAHRARPGTTSGTPSATPYHAGLTRQRPNGRRRPSNSARPPTRKATRIAASPGPKGTSGLLSGFRSTSGQMDQEMMYARPR